MKRRLLAAFCLLLFVAGTLIVPALHKWDMANFSNDSSSTSLRLCSSVCGCHRAVQPDSSDNSDQPIESRPHDPDNCPICSLAQMPLDAAISINIPLPPEGIYITAFIIQPVEVDFKKYQNFPFSCGPPC